MLKISIVIVCMDNLSNLRLCLTSIRAHTTLAYETIVVAYLFSPANLKSLTSEFPWVRVIESRDIRGFSENNNLGLRQASGEYTLILNDDTFLDGPAIDTLAEAFSYLPENTAIVSPLILNVDGSVQCSGRPKASIGSYCMGKFHVARPFLVEDTRNQEIPYISYNILGAGFLIKTCIFRTLGFFDERYFFCPEDIALSTLAIEKGYACYVHPRAHIYHIGGVTIGGAKMWSPIITATEPAEVKGNLIFYSRSRKYLYVFVGAVVVISHALDCAFYSTIGFLKHYRYYRMRIHARLNGVYAVFSPKTPKQLFVHFCARLH